MVGSADWQLTVLVFGFCVDLLFHFIVASAEAMVWTAEDEQKLKAMMSKKAEAVAPPAVDESCGAMTDGTKRRLVSASEFEFVGNGYDGSPVHCKEPWVAERPAGSLDLPVVGLPPGVSSFEDWGKTLAVHGKWSDLNFCYREIMELDEHAGYRKWAKAHLNTKTAKGAALDFARYRDMWMAKVASQEPLIPGTEMVRRYKA